MKFSDTSYNLRIELDTKHCELAAPEIEKLERGLEPLRKPVEAFPVSDLYITIMFHPRSSSYRVKTALVLTGRTLVSGDADSQYYPAFERCVRKLIKRLDEYKGSLGSDAEQAKQVKGTHHEVTPEIAPDAEQVQAAIDSGDYGEFRRATLVYEESIRKRIGRWVARYPELDAQIGDRIHIADLVEEVFLNAFERFENRPTEVRFSQWLEDLIDPSVRLVLQNPDQELENIEFARSATGVD
ncbi:MAG: hypothetical protein R3C99_12945 [Pirellulaceae bacterium]